MSTATLERKYQMTRIQSGDYVFPSNDGRTIWRVTRYMEDGSLMRDDGSTVSGMFWTVARFVGSPEDAQRLVASDPDEFIGWERWEHWQSLMPTRRDAIVTALAAQEVAAKREP